MYLRVAGADDMTIISFPDKMDQIACMCKISQSSYAYRNVAAQRQNIPDAVRFKVSENGFRLLSGQSDAGEMCNAFNAVLALNIRCNLNCSASVFSAGCPICC